MTNYLSRGVGYWPHVPCGITHSDEGVLIPLRFKDIQCPYRSEYEHLPHYLPTECAICRLFLLSTPKAIPAQKYHKTDWSLAIEFV